MSFEQPTPENQEEAEILRQAEAVSQKARRGEELTQNDYDIYERAFKIIVGRVNEQIRKRDSENQPPEKK